MIKTCFTCENNFETERKKKVYCSDVCRKKAWKIANKEHETSIQKAWQKANLAKCRKNRMKRHAAKLQRTPQWLTIEHFKQIEQYYIDAVSLSLASKVEREVDHIIPLQGKHVSGLHVPWNLQILTKQKNRSKGNA